MKNYQKEMIRDILVGMPEAKMEALKNACSRNSYLTSYFGLEHGMFYVYKEGFRVELLGTRSSFSVYVKDNDGDLEYTRKPAESKLHPLYELWFCTDNVLDLYDLIYRPERLKAE